MLPDAAVHGLSALPLDLDVDDALEGLVDLLDDLGQLEYWSGGRADVEAVGE